MQRIKILIFSLFLAGVPFGIRGFSASLVSSFDDVAFYKKARLHCELDANDAAIIKRSLQFSIDNPDIVFVSWQSLNSAVSEITPPFRKPMLLFNQSFDGWLTFESSVHDIDKRKELLCHSQLYVSCLVVSTDGVVRPYTQQLALATPEEMPFKQTAPAVIKPVQLAKAVPAADAVRPVSVKNVPVSDLEQEIASLEHLGVMWNSACKACNPCARQGGFFVWYIVLLFMLFLLIARRRWRWARVLLPVNRTWEQGLLTIVGFLVLGGGLCIAAGFVSMPLVLSTGALLCGVMLVYSTQTPPFDDVFIGRLKNLIAIIAGISVLPLLLCAYLHFYGLL